jgi:hypothetical protein
VFNGQVDIFVPSDLHKLHFPPPRWFIIYNIYIRGISKNSSIEWIVDSFEPTPIKFSLYYVHLVCLFVCLYICDSYQDRNLITKLFHRNI